MPAAPPSSGYHPPRIRPGVVSGDDYKTLLQACRMGGYALPAVNVNSSSSINAVLEAARQNGSDVIVQVSASGAHFFAGQNLPDPTKAKILGAVAFAQHVHLLAQHYGVAVILHTDHADRPLIGWLDGLITESQQHYARTGRPLFSSHMLDLSTEPVATNIATAATMLKRLAPLDIGLEIELGMTGGEEDGIGQELTDSYPACNPAFYTRPEEVLKAWETLSPLGMLSIAASFGNVHGVYKPGNVHLEPDILRRSQALIARTFQTGPNPVPFVFHGGSGSTQEDIQRAVQYGVFKFNIDTDTQFAFSQGVARYIAAHEEAFKYQISPQTGRPLKHDYDPRRWLRAGEVQCIERLTHAFRTLGSQGRSIASQQAS